MPPTKDSGYGRALFGSFAPRYINGRILVVGASTLPGQETLQRLFSPDTFGKVRYFSTLAAAVAMAQANRDTIYIVPGHTETISSSTALNISVAGLQIVGLGIGALRPTFTLNTATSTTITVSAANVRIENVVIDGTGFDAIAAVITVTATNFQLANSELILANATNQAVLGISIATGLRASIVGNRITGTVDAGTTAAIQFVGGADHVITDNVMIGAYTAGTGAISNLTTAALRCDIARNVINNLTASSTKAMTFVAGSTGTIRDNRMQILSGAAPITGAAMSWVGSNYYAATIATLGTLI